MNRHFLNLLAIGCLLAVAVQAQQPTQKARFLKEGARWTERSSTEARRDVGMDELSADFELTQYAIEGEETINGLTYKKVTRNGEGTDWLLREDADGTVYFRHEGRDLVLYRFGWDSQDPLQYAKQDGKTYVWTELERGETTLADGSNCAYIQVGDAGMPMAYMGERRLLQGIGLTTGILQHTEVAEPDCYCFHELVGLYDGGKAIYESPRFRADGQPKTDNAIHSLIPATCEWNVENGRLHGSFPSADICQVQLYDNDGRLCLSQRVDREATTCELSVETLPKDTYLLIATRADGSRQSFKVVR